MSLYNLTNSYLPKTAGEKFENFTTGAIWSRTPTDLSGNATIQLWRIGNLVYGKISSFTIPSNNGGASLTLTCDFVPDSEWRPPFTVRTMLSKIIVTENQNFDCILFYVPNTNTFEIIKASGQNFRDGSQACAYSYFVWSAITDV